MRPLKFRGRALGSKGLIVCGALLDYGTGDGMLPQYWIHPEGETINYPVDEDSIAQVRRL